MYKVIISGVQAQIIGSPLLPESDADESAVPRRKVGGMLMTRKLWKFFLPGMALLAVAVPLFAHHGNASYDTEKSYNVKGAVTAFIWANPHVFIKVDVKDDSGNIAHWIVEAQNPVSMSQIGWSKDTFKPGDQVEIDAMPAKNGNPVAFLGSASPTAPRRRIVINGKQFQ
jgi:uncharacterized protein DUF6152